MFKIGEKEIVREKSTRFGNEGPVDGRYIQTMYRVLKCEDYH